MTVGKNLTKRGTLADKDWYFPGHIAKEEANKLANQRAQQWEVICRKWAQTEEPLLRAFGVPLPEEPRWNSDLSTGGKHKLTVDQLEEIRRENLISDAELGEVMSDEPLSQFIPLYEQVRGDVVVTGQMENSSLGKLVGQMRRFVSFIPDTVPARELTETHFSNARTEMLKVLKPRTVRNYINAGLILLKFVLRRYGGGAAVSTSIEEVAVIKGSTRTDIRIYKAEEVSEFLRRTAGTISQMDAMLCLNCGMYPDDIGRLLLAELDFTDNSVFWDRQKEPGNPFRLHHIFWPETLMLVKRFLNDGRSDQTIMEYRRGRNNPMEVRASEVAFLHKGKPRYWTTPSGHAKDKVSDAMAKLVTDFSFKALRKTASQWFVESIEHDASDLQMGRVEELRKRFIGQRTDALVRLYQTMRKKMYVNVNRYLATLGDKFRSDGLFDSIKP